jgi:putative ABC transport system substrate-binding protein
MQTHKTVGLLFVSLALLGIIIAKRTLTKKNTQWTVGILQTATHPALDAVTLGFTNELTSILGNKVSFIIQNAEGSVSNMQTMAQGLRSNGSVDLLFAVATPAAQAVASLEKEKPIIFAAVTDPQAAGLTGQNITGVTDMIDVKKQIDLLTMLVPHAQTVGLIFNRGEINSLTLAEQMKAELERKGLTVLEFGVINESEIPAAAQTACRKTDVILAPTDNTVASTIKVITNIAQRMQKAVIVSDALLVSQGALAAQGIDYATCGAQAAQLTAEILQGSKQISNVPVVTPESKTVINRQEFDRLQLNVPSSLQQQLEYI